MPNWEPASRQQVEAQLASELAEAGQRQGELFERIRTATHAALIECSGSHEAVFVVARLEDRVIYYDDIHGSFELAAHPDEHGVLGDSALYDMQISALLEILIEGEAT